MPAFSLPTMLSLALIFAERDIWLGALTRPGARRARNAHAARGPPRGSRTSGPSTAPWSEMNLLSRMFAALARNPPSPPHSSRRRSAVRRQRQAASAETSLGKFRFRSARRSRSSMACVVSSALHREVHSPRLGNTQADMPPLTTMESTRTNDARVTLTGPVPACCGGPRARPIRDRLP
jgi:hypothetical protein